MITLSATCLAIALADKNGTLRLTERASRLGGTYISIEDDRGIIEVQDTREAARARVESVR